MSTGERRSDRRRRARWAAISVLVLPLLGACSVLVNTDHLSNDAPITGLADAATDATSEDVAPLRDGAADAAPDSSGELDACPPPLAQDSFERSETATLGEADVGGAWSGTSPSLCSVADGRANVSLNAGKGVYAFLPAVKPTDVDVSFVFTVSSLVAGSSGAATYVTAAARRSGSSDDYHVTVLVKLDGRVDLYLTRRIATTDTTLTALSNVAGIVLEPEARYHLRFIAQGSNPTKLRARLWPDGSPEPTTTSLEATDATEMLQTAGHLGWEAYLSSAASNGPIVVTIDDFVARTPDDACAP